MDKRKTLYTKVAYFVVFLFCIGLIIMVDIWSAIKNDEPISQTEYRALQQFERPYKSTILDGGWMLSFERYISDQLVVRDALMKSYFGLLDILGTKERNGYVIAQYKKDTLVLKVPNVAMNKTNEQQDLEKKIGNQLETMKSLKDVCTENGAVLISLQIPHETEIYQDYYPKYYEFDSVEHNSLQEYIDKRYEEEGIDVLDVGRILRDKMSQEQVYFYTDHHYTYKGAYYAYKELLKYINVKYGEKLSFPDWNECPYEKDSRRFVGSSLRTFGDSGRFNADSIEYVYPSDMPKYSRYEEGELSDIPIFDCQYPKYSCFMGGDKANTQIHSNRTYLPNILFIGYSYTNPLECMAIYSFNEMHSIDPRHYTGSIEKYICDNEIDYVVVVRNDYVKDEKSISKVGE